MTPTPTEIADSLLPCPFPHLGKELLHGSWPAKHQFWIHCPCGAMGPHADSPAKAIAAWNRRATSRGHRAAAEEINAYLWTHHGISLSKDTYQQLTAIIAKHAGVRPEISRALGGAVGDEWRGIETHDGSTGSVLVWMPGWPCGFEAKWHPDHKGWWLAGSDPTDYYDGQREPTHWRPLPPPPSALKPQGGEE